MSECRTIRYKYVCFDLINSLIVPALFVGCYGIFFIRGIIDIVFDHLKEFIMDKHVGVILKQLKYPI